MSEYKKRPSSRSSTGSLNLRKSGEYYHCPHCNHATPKREVRISGYDSQSSQRHIHCLRCGKMITDLCDDNGLGDIIKGAGIFLSGSVFAYLFFPILNVFALEMGFLTSLYGALKFLIRPSR